MRHKHYDMIVAWADGAKIQARFPNGEWQDFCYPIWDGKDIEYRIKPEPKPDVVVYSRVVGKFLIGCGGIEIQQLILRPQVDNPNIKYTFDGEWGKLKSAEVL
jgi:hypothetical protein